MYITKIHTKINHCKNNSYSDHLPNLNDGGSIESTISINADRNPYSSGIFLPTIPQNYGITTPEVYSELAVRLISRNKPSSRTNKANHSCMVVETLSHPIQKEQGDIIPLLTKHEKITMLFKFLLLGENASLFAFVLIQSKKHANAFNSQALLFALQDLGKIRPLVIAPILGR